jgi:hypothetical protein
LWFKRWIVTLWRGPGTQIIHISIERTPWPAQDLSANLNLAQEVRPEATHLAFEHVDQGVGLALVANALGTGSFGFARGLLAQLADVARTGKHSNQRS